MRTHFRKNFSVPGVMSRGSRLLFSRWPHLFALPALLAGLHLCQALAFSPSALGTTCSGVPAVEAATQVNWALYAPGYGYIGMTTYGSGFGTITGSSVGNSTSATNGGGDDPSSSFSATSDGPAVSASAVNEYFLTACGPDGTVPLFVSASVIASAMNSANANENANAGAEVLIAEQVGSTYEQLFYIYAQQALGPGGDDTGPTSVTNQIVDIPANSLIEITTAASGFVNGGSASGSADPFIEIDPAFANAGEYTLEFSDGITAGAPSGPGGSMAVPEPASLAFCFTGLVGVGFLRRRKAL